MPGVVREAQLEAARRAMAHLNLEVIVDIGIPEGVVPPVAVVRVVDGRVRVGRDGDQGQGVDAGVGRTRGETGRVLAVDARLIRVRGARVVVDRPCIVAIVDLYSQ